MLERKAPGMKGWSPPTPAEDATQSSSGCGSAVIDIGFDASTQRLKGPTA